MGSDRVEPLLSLLKHNFLLSDTKELFILGLTQEMPGIDPCVQSADGHEIDILWGNDMMISLNEDDSIAVSDFTSDEQLYAYFEATQVQEAVKHVVTLLKQRQ